MKIAAVLSFLGISLVVLLSSCSIDKKVYSPGYHVEWNNPKNSSDRISSAKPIKKEGVRSRVEAEPPQIDTVAEKKREPDLVASSEKQIFLAKIGKVKLVAQVNNTGHPSLAIVKSPLKKVNEPEPKMNGFALASLLCLLIGFSFLSIIFAAIALKQIRKNPELYKGKGLARICLALGIISLILGLIFLILLFSILHQSGHGK